MRPYVDATRLAERRDGWLGSKPLPDPQHDPPADYQGTDPDIEALRRECWPREEQSAA